MGDKAGDRQWIVLGHVEAHGGEGESDWFSIFPTLEGALRHAAASIGDLNETVRVYELGPQVPLLVEWYAEPQPPKQRARYVVKESP